MSIIIASTASIKLEPIRKLVNSKFPEATFNIIQIDCTECNLPPQPTATSAYECVSYRLNYIIKKNGYDPNNYYFAIENGANFGDEWAYDFCVCGIAHKGIIAFGISSLTFDIDQKYIDKLYASHHLIKYVNNIEGYDKTLGEIMHEEDPNISKQNWMGRRYEQIFLALKKTFDKHENMLKDGQQIMAEYKVYENFPTEGVDFQDVFSILKNSALRNKLLNLIVEKYKYSKIDCVVGLESRGLAIGLVVAHLLGVDFVPIRKAGKLAGEVIQVKYTKEYGEDICEMQTDIKEQSRVLLIDDLVATGGSLMAGISMLLKLNCIIVECCVIRQVDKLIDIIDDKLKKNISVLLT